VWLYAVGEIADDAHRYLTQRGDRGVHGLGTPPNNRDSRAGLNETLCDRKADAAVTASDDSCLALKKFHSACSSIFRSDIAIS
jgi:hypothetical protein